MIRARVLAYVTGTVNQELLLRNEYLAAENRILRAKIKGRLLLSDAERNSGRDCSPARTKSAERFGGGRETGNAAELANSSPTSTTWSRKRKSGAVHGLTRKRSDW
jgi:hypothetical protein